VMKNMKVFDRAFISKAICHLHCFLRGCFSLICATPRGPEAAKYICKAGESTVNLTQCFYIGRFCDGMNSDIVVLPSLYAVVWPSLSCEIGLLRHVPLPVGHLR